jgi:hypothetical protein
MKFKQILNVVLILATYSIFCGLEAQEEKPKTQGFIVWEDQVQPSKVEAYENGSKKMLQTYGENGLSYEIHIYSTDDYRYYWVVDIDRFADIDTLYREFSKIYKAMGEEASNEIDAALDGTINKTKIWTCYWRSDLSYMPEIAADSGDFRFWGFMYVKQGKQQEMQDILKEWAALYKSNGIDRGFGGFVGDIGTEMPFMFYLEQGKSPAEYYQANEAVGKKLGEKADELWERTAALLRGFEPVTGWYRKDLSYYPD